MVEVHIWREPKDNNNEITDIWYVFEIDDGEFENNKTTIKDLITKSDKIYEVIANITKNIEVWKAISNKEYLFNVFENWLNLNVEHNDIDMIVYHYDIEANE